MRTIIGLIPRRAARSGDECGDRRQPGSGHQKRRGAMGHSVPARRAVFIAYGTAEHTVSAAENLVLSDALIDEIATAKPKWSD